MVFNIKDNRQFFLLITSFTIIFHLLITLILIILRIPLFEQLSFEILNILIFIFLLIISRYNTGIFSSFFIVLTAFIVALVEINNILIKNNYTYTRFHFWIIKHESTNILPSGGYPLVITFGWILCIYSAFLLTNFIFGTKNNTPLTKFDVFFRISFDAIITWTFAIFLEGTGENLEWWKYASKVPDDFFGVPIGTLYYYALLSIFFSTVLRFSIYFSHSLIEKRENVDFYKLKWISIYIPTMFIYSWFFVLILSISKFGFFHWSLAVSIPPLFLYVIIVTKVFLENDEIGKNLIQLKRKQILVNFGKIIPFFLLVTFFVFVLNIYNNQIYTLVIIILIFSGFILILWEYNSKKNV